MSANERQVGGKHYNRRIQHWDYIVANDIPYLEAQIIKYVTRWRDKNGIQDLEKARHFLEKLIEVQVVEEVGDVDYEVNPDRDQTVRRKAIDQTSVTGKLRR